MLLCNGKGLSPKRFEKSDSWRQTFSMTLVATGINGTGINVAGGEHCVRGGHRGGRCKRVLLASHRMRSLLLNWEEHVLLRFEAAI